MIFLLLSVDFLTFWTDSTALSIVPRTIISALTQHLPLHGGGSSVRSFIHGSDVALGILRLIDAGEPGEYLHFSTEEFVTIRDLVKMICDLSSVSFDDVVVETEDRAGKDAAYLMDAKKAQAKLG